jgi:hypothetical protein
VVSLAVVFLPDTALLVPGAGGLADPAAGLRATALAALGTADVDGRVLVVAPGRRTRALTHPVGLGLGAAGLGPGPLDGRPGQRAAGPGTGALDGPPARRADVAASTALVLLQAAGVRAPVDVHEVDRADGGPPPARPSRDDLGLLVVVGSLSARHGPDAPLADDPRAPAADAALLAALGDGPAALAAALDRLGPDAARDLAISGAGPWRVALGQVPDGTVEVTTRHAEVLAGAQHAVVTWTVTPATTLVATPGTITRTAPEEPR